MAPTHAEQVRDHVAKVIRATIEQVNANPQALASEIGRRLDMNGLLSTANHEVGIWKNRNLALTAAADRANSERDKAQFEYSDMRNQYDEKVEELATADQLLAQVAKGRDNARVDAAAVRAGRLVIAREREKAEWNATYEHDLRLKVQEKMFSIQDERDKAWDENERMAKLVASLEDKLVESQAERDKAVAERDSAEQAVQYLQEQIDVGRQRNRELVKTGEADQAIIAKAWVQVSGLQEQLEELRDQLATERYEEPEQYVLLRRQRDEAEKNHARTVDACNLSDQAVADMSDKLVCADVRERELAEELTNVRDELAEAEDREHAQIDRLDEMQDELVETHHAYKGAVRKIETLEGEAKELQERVETQRLWITHYQNKVAKAGAKRDEGDIEDLQSKLEAERKKIEHLDGVVDTQMRHIVGHRAERSDLNAKVEDLRDTIASQRNTILSLNRRLSKGADEPEVKLSDLSAKTDSLVDQIQARLTAEYGRRDWAKVARFLFPEDDQ